MRSYSARVIVCLVALVESSTMKVDLVLRESTLALTTTLPNSVTTAFGIFSASSRRRSAAGFHSTVAAFTSCATCSSSSARLIARSVPGPAFRNARSCAPCTARSGECTPAWADRLHVAEHFRPGPAPAWAGKRGETPWEKGGKPRLAGVRKAKFGGLVATPPTLSWLLV